MYDELTKVDIDKMKEELEYRITVVRPKILEEVKFTRSFGGFKRKRRIPRRKARARQKRKPNKVFAQYD